jgi:hypothetical protein
VSFSEIAWRGQKRAKMGKKFSWWYKKFPWYINTLPRRFGRCMWDVCTCFEGIITEKTLRFHCYVMWWHVYMFKTHHRGSFPRVLLLQHDVTLFLTKQGESLESVKIPQIWPTRKKHNTSFDQLVKKHNTSHDDLSSPKKHNTGHDDLTWLENSTQHIPCHPRPIGYK